MTDHAPPVREASWLGRLRSGEAGALPAILGFIVLTILFSVLRPDTFFSTRNAANLLIQSAPVIFIAMGLIFVLLIGEIDLSAGFTAGAAAAVMAKLSTHYGLPWPLAICACLATGLIIGLVIGVLVARLKVPSFVVTLAAFLGLQGVLLLIIGDGGTISVTSPALLSLMNGDLSPPVGWAVCALIIIGHGGVQWRSAAARRRAGLAAPGGLKICLKVLILALPLATGAYLLNQERAVNPAISSLKGIPIIVPFTALFVIALGWLLSRTRFGRYVYAVGGNAEAARRAGIDVAGVRIACFAICSVMAAVAGILFTSYNNSVSPTTGGSSTLLYAVGAAVIGGTSLFGGKGRVIDAILGGLVVAVIANGLPLITQRSGVQFIVTGLVLLLAAAVDATSRRQGR